MSSGLRKWGSISWLKNLRIWETSAGSCDQRPTSMLERNEEESKFNEEMMTSDSDQ
jgi:hypothetical protein